MSNVPLNRRRFLQDLEAPALHYLCLKRIHHKISSCLLNALLLQVSSMDYTLSISIPNKLGLTFMPPCYCSLWSHSGKEYTVFSGLDHNLSGGHNATKYFLSGIPVTEARGYSEGNISIDQKAAQFVGGKTRFSSLVLDAHSGEQALCLGLATPMLSNPSVVLSNSIKCSFEGTTLLRAKI